MDAIGCAIITTRKLTTVIWQIVEWCTLKDVIDKTYGHNDVSEELGERYNEHMHKFAIFDRYDVMINSEAYNQLLNEKNDLEQQLKKLKKNTSKK